MLKSFLAASLLFYLTGISSSTERERKGKEWEKERNQKLKSLSQRLNFCQKAFNNHSVKKILPKTC